MLPSATLPAVTLIGADSTELPPSLTFTVSVGLVPPDARAEADFLDFEEPYRLQR